MGTAEGDVTPPAEGDVTPPAEGGLSVAPEGTGTAPERPEPAPGRIELVADANRDGGRLLLVDRVRQSYVDLDDPGYLMFEYARTVADIIDLLPAGRLAVTHVGGGAGSIARYVQHTRPGSPQIMLEPDEALTALVRQRAPYPRNMRLRIRPVGGRDGIEKLATGSADVVVLDAFDGGYIPAELTTAGFFAGVARVLRPDGILLANIVDGPPAAAYLRRALATIRGAFPAVVVVGDAAVLKVRRFGNVVVAAAPRALPELDIERAAARADFPRRVLRGEELSRFIASARPLTDSDALRSPEPPDEIWRVAPA